MAMILRSSAIRILGLLACLAAAACGLEKEWLFFPDRGITSDPSDAGLAYEDLTLTASDGVRINAWFVPAAGSRTVLLWLHGNAGNLSNRVTSIAAFHRSVGVNILMIDYRQYGESGGRISEEGTYRDAEAAYDYLSRRPDLDPGRIVVFGQSLGSAVAVELAVRRRIAGLILGAPFTSLKDLARKRFPWLPVWGLFRIRYDSLSKIGRNAAPLLILHGDRDEVVPYEEGKRLFEAAPEPKTFYTITGAGHNNALEIGGDAYLSEIRKFIDGLPGFSGNPTP
jgi:fermentation-respiration switch protein FrsA (DUF1100 family)